MPLYESLPKPIITTIITLLVGTLMHSPYAYAIRMSGSLANSASIDRFNIALIGGGITGATAAQTLAKYDNLNIHVFDQGQRGVGGRTSSRYTSVDVAGNRKRVMRWDHGCQFFRSDTPKFQSIVKNWIDNDFVREWRGKFVSSSTPERDFFGLPSIPPFYVGADGMQSVPKNIFEHIGKTISDKSSIRVFSGTRVAQLERDENSNMWRIYGTSGTAAFHDTPEKTVKELQGNSQMPLLGDESGYNAVILTDVSSSFGKWHRASAGVPEQFAERVRKRVGARVPLFSAMIAFENESGIPFDAASFDNPIIWFAAKSNSKPGMETMEECWTIVSTPEYAMAKIEETPMQDSKTGEFIPQSKDYLTSVPGPDLTDAFCKELTSKDGILGDEKLDKMPEILHMGAQRWGSAMPCHRHLRTSSPTRKLISGVAYDSGRFPLAPTVKPTQCHSENEYGESFVADEHLMLFQAGDMVSNFTPGFESAVLSGHDAARHVWKILMNNEK